MPLTSTPLDPRNNLHNYNKSEQHLPYSIYDQDDKLQQRTFIDQLLGDTQSSSHRGCFSEDSIPKLTSTSAPGYQHGNPRSDFSRFPAIKDSKELAIDGYDTPRHINPANYQAINQINLLIETEL